MHQKILTNMHVFMHACIIMYEKCIKIYNILRLCQKLNGFERYFFIIKSLWAKKIIGSKIFKKIFVILKGEPRYDFWNCKIA